MRLILVRHAEAVDVGVDGVATDFDRHLTPLGHEQAAALARSLAARGVVAGAVVTSPLVRAMQTAQPLTKLLRPGLTGPIVNEYLAAGELRRRRLSRAIADLSVAVAILVGHNPDLEEYLGWLVCGEPTSIRLEKGSAAQVRFDGPPAQGAGSLEWLITPAWYLAGP
jgi:phosphohistidine phosphatase